MRHYSSKEFPKDTKKQTQELLKILGLAPGDNTGGASGGAGGISGEENEKV